LESEDIIELTEEDKTFLENFSDMMHLSIVSCKLKSLKNFPKLDKLERVSAINSYV